MTFGARSSFILSLLGLGVALYLSFTHYEGTQFLACATNGTFNCDAVTTSAQSVVFGVPVAVLGAVWFSVLGVVCSPWGWRRSALVRVREALDVLGMGFVLWLVAAELLIIGHLCWWCTGIHLISFVLMIIVLGARGAARQDGASSDFAFDERSTQ